VVDAEHQVVTGYFRGSQAVFPEGLCAIHPNLVIAAQQAENEGQDPVVRRVGVALSHFLLGGFALFSVVLASFGIYGVISYSVGQRTQEIGIRMALGATAGDLQTRFLVRTLGLASVGMLVGACASWALTRTLGGFLFGVTTGDPVTFIGMLSVLTVVAGYIPARRASRIDPMSALRAE